MTKKQKEEFINKVKGKKIKKAYWIEGNYIVPSGEYDQKYFYGTDNIGEDLNLDFGRGLTEAVSGDYWRIIEEDE